MERVGADTNVVSIPRRPAGRARVADDAVDRAALVRAIAASPVHIAWLREHVGKILEREAHLLDGLGDPEAGEHLRRRAAAHVAGDTPLW